MGILQDLFTALKGGANELGEAVVDANAVRILEQEIRNAEEAINKAKQSLTQLKGTEIQLKRTLNSLSQDISDYEAKALKALDSGNEALATEVAERIADLEADHSEQQAEHLKLTQEIENINKLIRQRVKTIKKNKRELEKVKTVKQLQKATSSISSNIAATSSSGNRVNAALERVKAKQQNWQDNMEAGEWMAQQETSDDLDTKLKAAGIGASGSNSASVLERLKAKRNP